MKKSLLILGVLLPMAVSAQVSTNEYGQLQCGSFGQPSIGGIGTYPLSTNSSDLVVIPDNTVVLDTLSQISVLGKGKNKNGGYITFGDRKNVSIGESYNPLIDSDILELVGGEIQYKTPSNTLIYSYLGSGSFNFNTDVKVKGVYVSSDSRLKSNVEELPDLTSSLFSITPVSYTLNAAAEQEADLMQDGKSDVKANQTGDNRERFGFIAQEVKELFPQLVMEDEDGYLAVDYIGFIPLLVDAVKDLSAQVEEQKEVIAHLTAQPDRKRASIDENTGVVASLSQNKPNPFSQTTVIEMTLPDDVFEAFLCVYDLQGKQLMRFNITERGATSVTIDGRSFPAGMYIYTLIADGVEVATKRMILTD